MRALALVILLTLGAVPTATAHHDDMCFGIVGVAHGSIECWRSGPQSCGVRIANETTGPVANESVACPGHLCHERSVDRVSSDCEDRAMTGGRHFYSSTFTVRQRNSPGGAPDFDLVLACSRVDGPTDHEATGEPCRVRYERRAGPGPQSADAAPINRYPFLLP